MYSCVILDPRPIPAAEEANAKAFALGSVLGVEVTVPSLAARCVFGNIDPQHTGGRADRAAIEEVLECALPPAGAVLATVRPDLDSIGAMAVITMRAEGEVFSSDTLSRIAAVATSDTFARGSWPGVRPLPSADNPWPHENASAGDVRELAAIAAAIGDFKVPVDERVAHMRRWLQTGVEPESYRARVEDERADMIRALESGEIRYWTAADGRIAVVESTHRAATMVGYALAPVVVARNPAFRLGQGEAHIKYTVCAYDAASADIKSALNALSALEPGWGGSPTIGGSPQGVSSTLTTKQVVDVVARHLK